MPLLAGLFFGGASPLHSSFRDPAWREITSYKTEIVKLRRDFSLMADVNGQPALIFPAPDLRPQRHALEDFVHHHVPAFKLFSSGIIRRRRNGRWPLRLKPLKPALFSNPTCVRIGVEWMDLLLNYR